MDYFKEDLGTLKVSYRLQGAYNPYKYVQVEISGNGEGRIGYELYREYAQNNQEKEGVINFRVHEEKIKEIASLYEKAGFLDINVVDINKDKIGVTDVGTTTLTYSYSGKERKLSYGYVENNPLQEIVGWYWKVIKSYLEIKRQP